MMKIYGKSNYYFRVLLESPSIIIMGIKCLFLCLSNSLDGYLCFDYSPPPSYVYVCQTNVPGLHRGSDAEREHDGTRL